MADHSNENSNDSCIKKVGHADMIRRESEESVNAPIAAISEASWSYKVCNMESTICIFSTK